MFRLGRKSWLLVMGEALVRHMVWLNVFCAYQGRHLLAFLMREKRQYYWSFLIPINMYYI